MGPILFPPAIADGVCTLSLLPLSPGIPYIHHTIWNAFLAMGTAFGGQRHHGIGIAF